MQITIKTLTGRKQTFNFEETDTVSDVKKQLQEKEGIQVDQIRLIYSGKQLADDQTLKSYNIQAGGTIHVSPFVPPPLAPPAYLLTLPPSPPPPPLHPADGAPAPRGRTLVQTPLQSADSL